MNNKYTKPLLLIITFLILSITTTASFAYFTATVNGNNESYNTVITSGTMQLLLTDGDQVSLDNALPGSSTTKTFKVKNTGTVATTYDVYLSELINNFVDKNDLVYTLTSTNGCTNNTETVVPSVVGDTSKIVSSCSINSNIEHEYTLTINFKEDNTNQDDNKGKKFRAKISINEYSLKKINLIENMIDLASNGATDLEYDGVDTLGENGTPDNNLRYIGATPNNYIYYNCSTTNYDEMNDTTCEKWRIVGLMNNIEDAIGNSESRIKIIKNEELGYFTFVAWDTSDSSVNNGYGINQWGESIYSDGTPYEGADLMRELNTDYLGNITVGTDGYWYRGENNKKTGSIPNTLLNMNAQDMIQKVKWNTGAISTNTNVREHITRNMYYDERSENTGDICKDQSSNSSCMDSVVRTTSWIGKVALIYPSDYGYSTSGGININKQACLNSTLDNWSKVENDECNINSWIYHKREYLGTLSSASDISHANYVYFIGINGYLLYNYTSWTIKVRPSLYLKSQVSIVDGDGSESNPYKLTL